MTLLFHRCRQPYLRSFLFLLSRNEVYLLANKSHRTIPDKRNPSPPAENLLLFLVSVFSLLITFATFPSSRFMCSFSSKDCGFCVLGDNDYVKLDF